MADIACGSGSFLIAALRYLTQALYESLFAHRWLRLDEDGAIGLDHPPEPVPEWLIECVEDLPLNAADPEQAVRARLGRIIVERCVYGVDLDGLAVELARLALWIETMDYRLPFSFLDHKVKCGNALVGCWFDRFQDYPAMAWEREGGDKSHTTGVHFAKEALTKELKRVKKDVVKPELRQVVEAMTGGGHGELFSEFQLPANPDAIHKEALDAVQELHELRLTDPDAQALAYAEHFEGNEHIRALRDAFDTWCAVWFWPPDRLDSAPTPARFFEPPEDTRAEIRRLREQWRFFHWEIEFPDVFTGTDSGFNAVVGNPPWEIQKPNSMEFFSNIDPLYRSYGKQEAQEFQQGYFAADTDIERRWLDYNAHFKALSNWSKNVAHPFGEPLADGKSRFALPGGKVVAHLHEAWKELRAGRSGFADPEHAFRHQGSADLNTYKLFLEQGLALLRSAEQDRENGARGPALALGGGLLGLIVPSGIYTDRGTTNLRRLFLDCCQWLWLFGFENREKVFEIDSRFKFCPVIVRKGGATRNIRAAFMRRDIGEWEQAKGYRPDQYGHWLKGGWQPATDLAGQSFDGLPSSRLPALPGIILSRGGQSAIRLEDIEDVALPLYEGRMIGQFDFSEKGWVSGKGRSAEWRDIDWTDKVIEPQFLIGLKDQDAAYLKSHLNWIKETRGKKEVAAEERRLHSRAAWLTWRMGLWRKVGFMDVSSATNTRTLISSILDDDPCGNKVPILKLELAKQLTTVGNSFAFDFQLRRRLGGLTLNYFIVEETALPDRGAASDLPIGMSLAVSASAPRVSNQWLPNLCQTSWRRQWAVTDHERLRLRSILDAVVAQLYGLDEEDFRCILLDCDHPLEQSTNKAFTRGLDPKGFWRVDKEKHPELRHTVLAQVAFHDLKTRGLDAFLEQNDGEGWFLPETLTLADYGLGHDERAQRPQPVASALGDRFLPWQLDEDPAASWEECRLHAGNIRAIRTRFAPAASPDDGNKPESKPSKSQPAPAEDLLGHPIQTDLFGEEL